MANSVVFDPTQDYCTLFPDKLFGVDYSLCCFLHDIAYGGLADRKEADIALRDCVSLLFSETNLILGAVVATLMYLGVRLFGRSFYRQGKY